MSKYICDNGQLSLSGGDFAIRILCLNSVTIDISCDVIEYKCMGTDGWVDNEPGKINWNITAESALDDTLGVDLDYYMGTEVEGSFYNGEGDTYYGTCIVTGISINAPNDAVATVSWTLTGSGLLIENMS